MTDEEKEEIQEYEKEVKGFPIAELLDQLIQLRIQKDEGDLTENSKRAIKIEAVKREINGRLGISKDSGASEESSVSTGGVSTLGSFVQ